jgi:hypothetical protein
MKVFEPRTTAPAADDPHWIGTAYGGLNECLVIDKQTGSCLPNCVGYAWGRWYELLNARPKLCLGNAINWFGFHEGYARGQRPALGAVACWGGTQYGHVAIVESIGPDYIMVSQSNYGGARFEYKRADMISGGKFRSPAGNTAFQGFIYLPVKFEAVGTTQEISGPYKTVDDIARAIIRGTGPWYKCFGQTRYNKIRSYGFDPETVQRRINEIMKGMYR